MPGNFVRLAMMAMLLAGPCLGLAGEARPPDDPGGRGAGFGPPGAARSANRGVEGGSLGSRIELEVEGARRSTGLRPDDAGIQALAPLLRSFAGQGSP